MGQNMGFGAPMMAPDIAQKQYQLAQRQAYAQALMQQANEPLQGQMVGGQYIAPSWTQGLAKALGTYLGAKTMADMPNQQMELQQMQDQRLASQFGLGQPMPTMQAGEQPQTQGMPVAPQQATPSIPLLPGRSAQDSFNIARSIGMPNYMKMVAEQGFQKPMVVGDTLYDPMQNRPMFTAAKDGMQNFYGPDGVARTAVVPGYADANAAAEAAKAGAVARAQLPYQMAQDRDRQTTQAGLDIIDVRMPDGSTVQMPRGQYVQMAQGGGQAAAAPAANPGAPAPAAQPGGLGYTPPKSVLEAREQFGSMDAAANQLLSNIDTLKKSEGFGKNYGIQGLFPNMAGSKASDALALTNQVISQGWLEMRDRLKGTGTITDYESQKAEKAWSTLNDPRISEKLAREQLNILEDTIKRGVQRMRQKAGMSGEAPKDNGISNGNYSSLWGG